MSWAVVCAVAFVVSALTLFSGFGFGTLLMPAFAGSFLGARLLRTMTIGSVRAVVAAMLVVVGAGLASGLL